MDSTTPLDTTMHTIPTPLTSLQPGEQGMVVEIEASCRGAQRHRLMDLGIVPETIITAELVSPSGNLTAYRVRGALIALRDEQASHIMITPVEEEEK